MIRRERRIRPAGGFGDKIKWTASQETGDSEGQHDYCTDCGHKFTKKEPKFSRQWDHDVWCKKCDIKRP